MRTLFTALLLLCAFWAEPAVALMAQYKCDGMRECICLKRKKKKVCKLKEVELLAPAGTKVKRSGDKLTLQILHSQTRLKLKNIKKGSRADRDYSFYDYYEDDGFFVIRVTYYQGGDYLIVSEKNGLRYKIPSPPIFSPNGKRFASFNMDLETGYYPNVIEIWEISDLLTRKWALHPAYWGPSKVQWKGNKKLLIERLGPPTSKGQLKLKSLSLVETPAEWLIKYIE